DSFELLAPKIRAGALAAKLRLPKHGYGVVTMHRPSNVDERAQLELIADELLAIAADIPLVFPVHPRTRQRLQDFGLAAKLAASEAIHLTEPLSYVDFM